MVNAVRPALLAAAALALAGCGGGKSDVAKFDEAKLERLASAGDAAAIAERARRAEKADAEAAAAKAKSDAEQDARDARSRDADRKAYQDALDANDEARLEALAGEGNPAAVYRRGEARLKSDDQGLRQLGRDDIEYAADKGDADALLWVGYRRYRGVEGYAWNPATGRDMVERAANMGSRDAMYAAAQIYDDHGLLHDAAKARAWYQKAADAGLDAAKARLAELSANDRGNENVQ